MGDEMMKGRKQVENTQQLPPYQGEEMEMDLDPGDSRTIILPRPILPSSFPGTTEAISSADFGGLPSPHSQNLDKDTEDGECSSISESIEESGEADMEVESGILGDAESSPMNRNPKLIYQRLKSKFDAGSSPLMVQGGATAGVGVGSRIELSDYSDEEGGQSILPHVQGPRQYPNPYRANWEDGKRAERARRFHDPFFKAGPVGINLPVKAQYRVGDEEMLNLYKSCGLFTDDWGEPSFAKVGAQYRLDSILLRGINNMSTNEIFAYLFDMGLTPQAMEWVNDACCIVIYKDKEEAAASLLQVTKPISVDHEIVDKKKNLEIDEKPIPDYDGQDKGGEKRKESKNTAKQLLDYHGVSIIPYDKVSVPMPLGHVWRYAMPGERTNGILMRFATSQDRKQERAERFSEYYKKHGNPNNPHYRPDEEGPRRRRPFKRVRYNPSPQISSSEEDLKAGQKFNVWTKLSTDWHNEEDGGRSNSRKRRRDFNSNVRANTPIPQFAAPPTPFGHVSHARRENLDDSSLVLTPTPILRRVSVFEKLDKEKEITLKRGWHYDDGNENPSFTTGHASSDEEWTSRLKGPTMRMHADVEESRQKLQATRKKMQQQKPSISSRLGHRVDLDFHPRKDEPPPRRSVKDRLGPRQTFIQWRDENLFDDREHFREDEGTEDVDDDEYIQALLRDA